MTARLNSFHQLLAVWQSGRRAVAPIADFFGLDLVEWKPGYARMRLAVDRRLHNPMGILHGGVYCDVADAAFGCALAAALEPGEGLTTVDLTMKYFASFREGALEAEARLVRRGRRTAYLECELRGPDGELLAKAATTCLILEPGQTAEGPLEAERQEGTK